MVKFFVTSDLHFTDRERDSYRWNLFPWLEKKLLQRGCRNLFVLGDLTEHKDHHSSKLVNRIVMEFRKLQKATGASIRFLKGNHDYVDPACPFFSFLSDPKCSLSFYTEPAVLERKSGEKLVFLPHSRTPSVEWEEVKAKDADFVFCHQTLVGAETENGFKMPEGLAPTLLRAFFPKALIISGDIHVPQNIGPLFHYVGAPYPIHFGDSFSPRVLYWNGESLVSILHPTLKRKTLKLYHPSELSKHGLEAGDQVRIQIFLSKENFESWESYRLAVIRAAEKLKIEVFAIELRELKRARISPSVSLGKTPGYKKPSLLLKEFCDSRDLAPTLRHVGRELVEEVLNGKA